MAGRRKSKQARINKLSPRLKEDRISQLPDDLICQILSHLPIKDVVTTSVLSTRWRSLWLLVPCVDLNSQKSPDFNAFVSFGDMFSNSGRVSKVTKMIICRDTFKVFDNCKTIHTKEMNIIWSLLISKTISGDICFRNS